MASDPASPSKFKGIDILVCINTKNEKPTCLLVTATAEEYSEEINRLADSPIPFKACTSAEQALAAYSDESILFGRPDLIAEILPEMPTIDWVQSTWAGVTPLIDAERRDYTLTGVKDVFGPQMSEYVIGYLLAHELRVLERMQKQKEHNWFKGLSGSLEGKHLGVMGTGSIGQHIAKTAGFFDMTVTGLSRSGSPQPGFDNIMQASQLHEFLEALDYLIGILPNTPGTDKLLDVEALKKLPQHAYFINIGRSNVVDDSALIDALTKKELAGATLDVFDEEPIPEDSPLWDTPNLTITAHVAAVSYPSIIVPIFVDNYRRYTNKKPLKYVVDFDAGY
jgi:phosphoglycerate dehydrogenase-like enzyme